MGSFAATHISRTVILDLHESPNCFDRYADGRADYAGSEDGVHGSAGQVVL